MLLLANSKGKWARQVRIAANFVSLSHKRALETNESIFTILSYRAHLPSYGKQFRRKRMMKKDVKLSSLSLNPVDIGTVDNNITTIHWVRGLMCRTLK